MQEKQTYLFSIYLALLYTSLFLNFFSFPILWYSLVAFSPIIFSICYPRFMFKKNIYLLIFYIFLSVFFIIASSLTQNMEMHRTIVNLASIVSSLLNGYLLSQQKIELGIIKAPIIGFIIFSLFLFFKGIDPNFVFPSSSRNSFSWIAIFGSCLFYIGQQKKETQGNISIWPACCTFIISFWSLGRSGIISSAILLLGVIIYKFKTSKKRKMFLFILFILFAFSSYPFLKSQVISTNQVAMRFMDKNMIKDPRVEISSNYIKSINSIPGILFGTKLSTINYMEKWAFNLHNSFLNFHSFMGIGSLILIMMIIIGMIRKVFQKNLLGFIGIALLLRISTDVGAFIGPMDFLLFYFLFSEVKDPSLNGTSLTTRKALRCQI